MAGKKAMEALTLYRKGFNCAQATAMPFCEQFGMSRELCMRALEGFGSGIGGEKLVCGALSGAVFIAGLKGSDGNIIDGPSTKKQTYAVCYDLAESFRESCGSLFCAELKGEPDGEPLCPCEKCVMTAAAMIEKMI